MFLSFSLLILLTPTITSLLLIHAPTLHSTTWWSERPHPIPHQPHILHISQHIPLNQHFIYLPPCHSCVLMKTSVLKMCYPHTVPFLCRTPPLFYHYHSLLELQKHQLCWLRSYLLSIHLDLPKCTIYIHSLHYHVTVHVIPEPIPFFTISYIGDCSPLPHKF